VSSIEVKAFDVPPCWDKYY